MNYYRRIRTERRRELRKNETEAERIMWIYLRKMRMAGYIFRRQHSLDRYIADFYCPSTKLAIELDGGIHDTETQKQYDKHRDQVINNLGVTILRFKNQEVLEDPTQVLLTIRNKLDSLHISD